MTPGAERTMRTLQQLGYRCEYVIYRDVGTHEDNSGILITGGRIRIGAYMGLFSPICYLYGIALIILPQLFHWIAPTAPADRVWYMMLAGIVLTIIGVALDLRGRR